MTGMIPYNEMTEAARAGTDLAEVVGYCEWVSGNSPEDAEKHHQILLERLTGDATSDDSRQFADAYRAAADQMLAEHRADWDANQGKRLSPSGEPPMEPGQ